MAESDRVVAALPMTESSQCVDSNGVSFADGTVSVQFGRTDIVAAAGDLVSVPATVTNVSTEVYVPQASVIALVYSEAASNLDRPVVPVDWFVVSDDITVEPNSSQVLNVAWDVPEYLGAGTYRIVLHHGQWSMSDVLARGITNVQGIGSAAVTVIGEATRPSVVDPLSIQISGDGLNPAVAHFMVTNHLSELSIRGDVTWALYSGNAPFSAKLIAEGSEPIKLTPDAEREYEIEIPDSELDIRLLLITITTDAPEQLLIPVYIAPEGVGLLYEQPHVSFLGVRGDQYVACAYAGNQADYQETEEGLPVTLSITSGDAEVAVAEAMVPERGMSYVPLVIPLTELTGGFETISLVKGEVVYDRVVGLICESDLCAGAITASQPIQSGTQPFNQSFYFYVSIVLVAALLGYVVIRRLPV